MIRSKPRHGEPLFEVRNGKAYATKQFQQWIDDVTAAVNELDASLESLEARVEALESP